MAPLLSVEDHGLVRWLTIERPHTKNAIPADGWDELAQAFRDFEASQARVLVLRGRGGDLCSGAELSGDLFDRTPSAAENLTQMTRTGTAAITLHRLGKPTIAAIDGVAVGAGLGLALGCDIAIASERARFATIFVRRGLTLDFGTTWLLPRMVGMARARELALTGRTVDAAEALDMGLITQVVAAGDLVEAVGEAAGELAAGAPLAQNFVKVALSRSLDLTFEQAVEHEDQLQAVLLASEDFREGVAAFTERREPDFGGR